MYAYTPAIWVPLLGALFLAAMSLYSWRRRDAPAALPFAAMTLCSALFLSVLTLETAAVAPATKIAWFKFRDTLLLIIATVGTCFVLEYAHPGRWLTRRNLTLLSIPPVLHVIFLLVDESRFVWRSVQVGPDGSIVTYPAAENLILTAYGMGLVLVNGAALIWLFVHSPQHRWPVALILFGQTASRAIFLVGYAHLPWFLAVEPVILGAFLVWTIYAVALFGFRIFDPLPIARTVALEQMHDGMIVFDARWRVVGLNRAAAAMLSTQAARARGKLLPEILPAHCDALAGLADGEAAPAEISLDTSAGLRHYTLDLASLHDFRNLLVGHLLLLRDVTEHKRAEAQIMEQQRSLAMLREREQLARELHDGLGQVLAYAVLQLEVVNDQIAGGQAALLAGQGADAGAHLVEAGNYITRLSSIVEEAHADVREYILSLRRAPSDQRPLFAVLRQYLDGFSQNYDIPTRLTLGPGVDGVKLPLSAQMQLFRIMQEALSNARKHAGATCVGVTFETQDGRLFVRVEDDGRGFDPALALRDTTSHFGLRIMHERAEQIGGSVRVQSAPGSGTCVVVEVPFEASSSEERP